jgi:hypothetical protein
VLPLPIAPYERMERHLGPLRRVRDAALEVARTEREAQERDLELLRKNEPLALLSTLETERAAHLLTLLQSRRNGVDPVVLLDGATAAMAGRDKAACAAYYALLSGDRAFAGITDKLWRVAAPQLVTELDAAEPRLRDCDLLEDAARHIEERAQHANDQEMNAAAMRASGEYSKY